jgi:DNA-binding MarR family transcriptional regulator
VYAFERDKVARFELSFSQIYLLQLLRRKSPSRMSEVSAELGIPVSTATRLVGRLERMNLVNRSRDGKDRRVVYVSLNSNGEYAVRAVENHTFEVITGNLAGFKDDDVAAFIATARSMGRILETKTAASG